MRSRPLEGPPGRDAPVAPGPADEFPRHTAAERRADAAVHALGLTLGVAGCTVLVTAAPSRADLQHLVAVGAYAAGLMAMLGCSALYNLTPEGARKRLFRRLDHAAIFLMIAGTYTPFALVLVGGRLGAGLLALVGTVAGGGAAVELLGLRRHDGLSVAAYLLLGWCVLPALGPLSAALPPFGLALLVAGGVLYSVGVVFHLWARLPYHNAVWHGFVLAAAACHYAAVLRALAAA